MRTFFLLAGLVVAFATALKEGDPYNFGLLRDYYDVGETGDEISNVVAEPGEDDYVYVRRIRGRVQPVDARQGPVDNDNTVSANFEEDDKPIGTYRGMYRGRCGADGFYYRDALTFVICSNGIDYIQPCPKGSRNSAFGTYSNRKKFVYRAFCDMVTYPDDKEVDEAQEVKRTDAKSAPVATYQTYHPPRVPAYKSPAPAPAPAYMPPAPAPAPAYNAPAPAPEPA